MSLKIAILEDNLDRQTAMQAWLSDRLYMYEHVFFDEAAEMIQWFEANLPNTLLIGLDHDLELKPTPDGRCFDPGTGRDVADYLAAKTPTCPVVIHSTNIVAADGMTELLRERGWDVVAVRPYGDLDWIHEVWWPAIRVQLRKERSEKPKLEPRDTRMGQASPNPLPPPTMESPTIAPGDLFSH